MTDFDPVAEARRVIANYNDDHDEEYVGDVGWLIDYIEALVAALRETDEIARDLAEHAQWWSASFEKLTHDNRHLLEG